MAGLGGERADATSSNPESAVEAGLLYVDDSEAGIRRRRRGSAFSYHDARGASIKDEATLQRIRSLAIPPAYTDVWICADARGHLQATGRDARRRKQYRYHPEWRSVREREKFARLIEFAQSLPRLRRRLRKDLGMAGLPRDKVLALVVSVMAETFIRVGNDYYAQQNNSYGLTTLRNRHVKPIRGRLQFSFRGKSGQMRVAELDDRRLTRLVRRIQQLPGQRLFQYVDESGDVRPIDSRMVNDYLREACGSDFTAKDFRTFGGTLYAAAALAARELPKESETAQRETIAAAVKEVAAILGNTPAVCRNSYIHPDVFAGWLRGSLQRRIPAQTVRYRRELERRVVAFLKNEARHAPRLQRRRRRGAG
jgi:DNA topoisomerase-1